MTVVDLAQRETWNAEVSQLIRGKAARLTADPSFKPRRRYAYDLTGDDDLEAEVRNALRGERVRMYHATRLLPTEVDAVRSDGLRVLTDELREAKLAHAFTHISSTEAELLLSSGPLHWGDGNQEVRRDTLYVVAPFKAARKEWGLRPLLSNWGGESIYFGADREDGPRPAVLDRLNQVSSPAFIEVAAPVDGLCDWKYLWPAMVGGILRCQEPWNEWILRADIAPEHVLDIIVPGKARWPRSLRGLT